ncbi:sigma 54-interacting transcriptional regulator [Paraflavitalea sp. CAU 1676]|uniref:sigma 54-interacting transcriptional regulator n=1 Tax=Paraflavitalea sp. CAU 1676 TaxID=3032598 RepID=UPI0023D9A2BC|nr:sigma 54-interacting transcriptional regulator [Paraflavitalea sp. CAU 1676]MDF2191626.1 sigma 54-interacting transcriptional regulator [Paraflavitalea sp. CAU 1676]
MELTHTGSIKDLTIEAENALLLSLSRDITSCRTLADVQTIVSNRLASLLRNTEIMVCLNDDNKLTHRCYVHTVSPETMSHPDFARGSAMDYFINDGIYNIIETSVEPVFFDMCELVSRTNKPFYVDFWASLQIVELIGIPLYLNNECIGGAALFPKTKCIFTARELKLIQAVCSYVGIALANILAYQKISSQLDEIDRYKARLEQENQYLHEQIRTTTTAYEAMIGAGNGLREVMKLVSNVASSDSTVLIQGETGTGKELIARAIHQQSPRKDKMLVRVNCAALPPSLIESELFGHERGSFTGALDRRIGKFELAHQGTLFLDEIGELLPELQVKLLRALQEKEIERIGGRTVIKTDVRVIAATNRDLRKEVAAGRFRADLFYRLNVFPINLPPLRERKEDIPQLVGHFLKQFSTKMGRKVTGVSTEAVREMQTYPWPGNVRELEHIIERAVLMTTGDTITDVHLQPAEPTMHSSNDRPLIPLSENEKEYILYVLRKCNGRVRGAGGAAEVLNIPPTTLHSKMKKLGIRKTLS